MNTRISLLALILGGLCLAAGALSPLRAQDLKRVDTPMSFNGLANNQAICFSVGADFTSFSVSPVGFDVEVTKLPQAQVKIRLRISAAAGITEVEKAWGHSAEEWVTRPLQAADLQTLDNFLAANRAMGAAERPSSGGLTFDLVVYRKSTDSAGIWRFEGVRNEYYNPLPAAQREAFIKDFIGFKDKGTP